MEAQLVLQCYIFVKSPGSVGLTPLDLFASVMGSLLHIIISFIVIAVEAQKNQMTIEAYAIITMQGIFFCFV